PEISAATSDVKGRFAITGLAPGSYRLWARYGHFKQQELLHVDLLSGQRIGNLRLVFPIGDTIAISGRVVDSGGRGIQATVDLLLQDLRGRRSQSVASSTID